MAVVLGQVTGMGGDQVAGGGEVGRRWRCGTRLTSDGEGAHTVIRLSPPLLQPVARVQGAQRAKKRDVPCSGESHGQKMYAVFMTVFAFAQVPQRHAHGVVQPGQQPCVRGGEEPVVRDCRHARWWA